MTADPYTDVQISGSQIRLLHLRAGKRGDQIICNLFLASLDDPVNYVALSYTWGDSEDRKSITMCGQPIQVTLNLEAALQDLRLVKRDRLIWVDALCINQGDVNERNHQVSQMVKIFRTAEEVIVWLGYDPFGYRETDPVAISRIIEALEKHAEDHSPHVRQLEGAEHDEKWNCRVSTEIYEVLVEKISSSPWWTRVWTLQEAMFASKLTFNFAGCNISLHALSAAVTDLADHCEGCRCNLSYSFSDEYVLPLERRVQEILEFHKSKFGKWLERIIKSETTRETETDFDVVAQLARSDIGTFPLRLMTGAALRHCSDARDKVYGCAGFNPWLLTPDYSLSASDVHRNYVVSWIRRCENLDVLSTLLPRIAVSKKRTWISNWAESSQLYCNCEDAVLAVTLRLDRLKTSFASMYSKPTIDVIGEDTLIINGYTLDTVTQIGSVHVQWEPSPLQEWHSILKLKDAPDQQYITGTYLSTAFYQMSLAGKHCPDDQRIKLDEAFRSMDESADEKLEQVGAYVETRRTDLRCLIISSQGYIGLGPPATEPGDKICILLGGRVPYLLRETSETVQYGDADHACCQFVGDCYVEGLMRGEGMDIMESRKAEPQKFFLL